MMGCMSEPNISDIFLAYHRSCQCGRSEAALSSLTILPHVFILLTSV